MKQRAILLVSAALLVALALTSSNGSPPGPGGLDAGETANYYALFSRTAKVCPLDCWRDVNRGVALLHRGEATRNLVEALYDELQLDLPVIVVQWDGSSAVLRSQSERPLQLARTVERCVLVEIENLGAERTFTASFPESPESSAATVRSGETFGLLTQVHTSLAGASSLELSLEIEGGDHLAQLARSVSVEVKVGEPATLSGTIRDLDTGGSAPGRIWIRGSDGIYRHGFAAHASVPTLSEKRIFEILPGEPEQPVFFRLPFFYSGPAGQFTLSVPPGITELRLERGYEHDLDAQTVLAQAGRSTLVTLESKRFMNMLERGWVSGDTHVHWSINNWYEDEDYELLRVVQRAEDVRVVNNLTLRGSDFAFPDFVAPNRYEPGPVWDEDDGYLCYQGEEWRNNGGYGHLNLLNITELIEPLASGPDLMFMLHGQYDWPLPSAALKKARSMINWQSGGAQRGIAIPAHGFKGWAVAELVMGRLDSLDQMDPEDYYDILDCGFEIPITNGGDHPARTVGETRCYVKVDDPDALTYGQWIAGILAKRTFVTSGPLLFLRASVGGDGVETGGTLHLGSKQVLHLEAEAFSRDDPEHHVGHIQIVSNGVVLVDQLVNSQHGIAQVDLRVDESRWIIARCAPEGSEVFNPLDNPGVAHTSAIYVHADGDERIVVDPARLASFRDTCTLFADKIANRDLLILQHPWQRVEAEQSMRDAAQAYDELIARYASR